MTSCNRFFRLQNCAAKLLCGTYHCDNMYDDYFLKHTRRCGVLGVLTARVNFSEISDSVFSSRDVIQAEVKHKG